MTTERGPGELIDDRFRLIERLGSGAMGAVWRALDEVLQREVALKEVRPADPSVLSDPDFADMLRTRVLREARALARIQHPNVVTIHHVIDRPDEAHPWLVMELVRGGTLEDRLANGPMEPDEVAELGRGLLGGLRAAHAAGICHRDVKPANVLLRPDGSPVLTDFGIADLADTSRLTATGGLTGSPAYIAPERLYGQEGDPASDLWSLGMLLYVAVEGRHPLRQSTAAATLAAVMAGVVPPATRAGSLEPALRAVLVADPAGRATAGQLDDLLVRAIESGPVAAVPAAAVRPAAVSPVGQSPSSASLQPSDGSTTVLRRPGPPPKRRSRTGVIIASVAGALVVILIAGAAVAGNTVASWLRDQASLSAGQPPGASWTPFNPETRGPSIPAPPTSTKSTTPSESPPAAKPPSLHTEKGMRQAIAALKKRTGTSKFSRFVVYPDYASAEVPVKGRKNAIDTFTYDEGKVELRTSGAGSTDGSTTDVAKIDWDILPGLMKRADRTLKIKKPEHRYLIVDAESSPDGEPAIRVYVTDKYGGGHLVADLDGKVIRTYPAQ